jgi:predicted metalloprotease with PDZ domain
MQNQDMVYVVPVSTRTASETAQPAASSSQSINSLIGSLVSQIKVPKKQTAAEIDAKHRIYTRGLYDRLLSNPNMIREFKLTLPEVANAFEEKPDDYGLFFHS